MFLKTGLIISILQHCLNEKEIMDIKVLEHAWHTTEIAALESDNLQYFNCYLDLMYLYYHTVIAILYM